MAGRRRRNRRGWPGPQRPPGTWPPGRVGGGVAPAASHRSVRARLRHTARPLRCRYRTVDSPAPYPTVPQATARGSPPRGAGGAESASRGRCVHTRSEFDAPDVCPSRGSLRRRPLPSAGSPWGGFAGLAGTMRRSDPLLPVPPCSVVLRPTVPRVRLWFAPRGPTPAAGLGLSGAAAPRRLRGPGSNRVSHVPGEPLCLYARVFDPGATDRPGQNGRPARPPTWQRRRLAATSNDFGAP
mgnify:CR=1 FL=1